MCFKLVFFSVFLSFAACNEACDGCTDPGPGPGNEACKKCNLGYIMIDGVCEGRCYVLSKL